jgi:antitoxin YefM
LAWALPRQELATAGVVSLALPFWAVNSALAWVLALGEQRFSELTSRPLRPPCMLSPSPALSGGAQGLGAEVGELPSSAQMTRISVMTETLSLSYVKAHLSEIADRVEGQHDRVVVTRKGRPAAVLVSPDDLESLEETLAVLSDPVLMEQIREGEAAVEAGETVSLEELTASLKRRDAAA